MTQFYYRNRKNTKLQELPEYKTGSWINVENPTEQELISLSEELNLETDVLLDSLDPFEVPRIEKEDEVTYVFSRFAHKSGDKITTSPVLLVVSSNFFLTISQKKVPFL